MKDYRWLENWTDEMSWIMQEGQAVALALYDSDGKLVKYNDAMSYYLNNKADAKHAQYELANPTIDQLLESKEAPLVFEGLLTIGNHKDISYVLQSRVYRRADHLLLIAQADVPRLFDDNQKMSQLNREVNRLQRQLIKDKTLLQHTLKELKETQMMLVQSDKMNALGKLVAGLTHEMNNPMSFVHNNLSILQRYSDELTEILEPIIVNSKKDDNKHLIDKLEHSEVLDLLNDIRAMSAESLKGIDRMKEIIVDLQNFSRLNEADLKTVDLISNLRSTLSIVSAQMGQKQIQLHTEMPESYMLECYPGLLNQAILNILINAIGAVQVEGEITIKITTSSDFLSIEISDNGCGIPKEIQSQIFEPFFTTKEVGSGTGLGLSITYKIIHDLHKGSIELVSAPGEGSRFTLLLPLKPGQYEKET